MAGSGASCTSLSSSRTNSGDAVVLGESVYVRGEIDVSNVGMLGAALAKAATRMPEGFIVNLIETTYLDSAALAMFWAHVGRGPHYLVRQGSLVEHLFRISGLDRASEVLVLPAA
jgi:anti-anti-sigma factor